MKVGIPVRSSLVRPVEPLFAKVLQSRQELEAEQVAEGEADLALPMGVDVLLLDIHLGVMAQHPLDHGGDLGGGGCFNWE